jgi:hypothetical protein
VFAERVRNRARDSRRRLDDCRLLCRPVGSARLTVGRVKLVGGGDPHRLAASERSSDGTLAGIARNCGEIVRPATLCEHGQSLSLRIVAVDGTQRRLQQVGGDIDRVGRRGGDGTGLHELTSGVVECRQPTVVRPGRLFARDAVQGRARLCAQCGRQIAVEPRQRSGVDGHREHTPLPDRDGEHRTTVLADPGRRPVGL